MPEAVLKIDYVKTGDLKLNPQNPRKNDDAVDKIVGSMQKFGWTNPILVRRADNVVIAGHTRLKAAIAARIDSVPVVYLDLDPVMADAYMLADNKLSELALWDDEALVKIIGELQIQEMDVTALGFEQEEIDALLQSFDVIPVEGFSPIPDKPEFQQMTFTLHDSQMEIVKEAMKKAKGQDCPDGTNENSNGNALCFICRAFNGQS